MKFFRPKPPVSPQEYEWLLACFAWLRTVLDDAEIRPELVTRDHPRLGAAQTAPELFHAVRSLAGMEGWECRLVKVDARHDVPDLGLVEEASACGTFSIENGEAIIRYSSDMLTRPEDLAATFAHELCHYLLAAAGDPPGGPDLMEHSTDCAAVYLGFGTLLANSARRHETFVDIGPSGWKMWNTGYLSEAALVTATAMFAALHDRDLAPAHAALKPHLSKDLAKAARAIAQDFDDIGEAMQQVDLLEWSFT